MRPSTLRRVLAALGALVATLALTPAPAHAEPQEPRPGQFRRFAGTADRGESGDGGPATEATLTSEPSVAAGPDGTVYIAGDGAHRLRRVDRHGVIDTVAGTDGAAGAEAVTVSRDGVVYVVNAEGVWRRGPDGAFTVLGGGTRFGDPSDVAVDGTGTVYVADARTKEIVRVEENGGTSVVARTEQAPTSVAVDSSGSVYVATGDFVDARDHVGDSRSTVRRIARDGTVTDVLGGVGRTFSGDGPSATASGGVVSAVAVDERDNVYLVDADYRLVRMIGTDGIVTTVGAVLGFYPNDMSVGPNDDVYLAGDGSVDVFTLGTARPGRAARDPGTRWADEEPGTVVTVADAHRFRPAWNSALTVGPDGTVYFHQPPDTIAMLDRAGRLTVLDIEAWDHSAEPTSTLQHAGDLAAAEDGTLYVSDFRGIRRVFPDGGQEPVGGYGPMRAPFPRGQSAMNLRAAASPLAAAPDGAVFVLYDNYQLFRIAPDGTAELYAHADGAPDLPDLNNLTVGRHGTVYITDYHRDRVLAVDRSRTVRTIAGTSGRWRENSGDGGPATAAVVPRPRDVAVDPDGSVYVTADGDIRRIDPHGTITTIVAEAYRSTYPNPTPVAVDRGGNVYFIDDDEGLRVVVRPAEPPAPPFPWYLVWLGAAALVLLAAVATVVVRRNR